MKIGFNKKTGHHSLLTSWKKEDDPRSGDATFGVDPQRPSQIFIWWDSHPYARPDVIYGNWASNGLVYLNYVRSDEGIYVDFGVLDNSVVSRVMLNRSGAIEELFWQGNISKWTVLWSAPKVDCHIYAMCGPFGSCDVNRPGICSCLTGFKPSIQKDWENRDWSGGCVRQQKLKCDNGDVFMRYGGMKLPDHSIPLGNLTIEECEIQCRRNCSCIAYAHVDGSDPESRCMYWSGTLMDVSHIRDTESDLFVRLDGSELQGSEKGLPAKSKKSITIPIATAMAAILLIGTLCCFLLVRKFGRPKNRRSLFGISFKAPSVSAAPGTRNGSEVNSFSLSSILAATDSFSVTNKLGEGGFGPVYWGTLVDGIEIAVKKLSENSGQGLEEFMNEVTLIANLQHKNLVRLMGCFIQKEEKMLIYMSTCPTRARTNIYLIRAKE